MKEYPRGYLSHHGLNGQKGSFQPLMSRVLRIPLSTTPAASWDKEARALGVDLAPSSPRGRATKQLVVAQKTPLAARRA
jgi:hypothetical protein